MSAKCVAVVLTWRKTKKTPAPVRACGEKAEGKTPAPVRERGEEIDRREAEDFIRLHHAENPGAGPVDLRLREVLSEIDQTGTYTHTTSELTFGARVAWRNSSRCIGRLYWKSLQVRDRRHIDTADGVAEECVEHLRAATGKGRIRPTITVFAPDRPGERAPRILNDQLIRYAGYTREDGSVLGDPANAEITRRALRMGWRGRARGSTSCRWSWRPRAP